MSNEIPDHGPQEPEPKPKATPDKDDPANAGVVSGGPYRQAIARMRRRGVNSGGDSLADDADQPSSD